MFFTRKTKIFKQKQNYSCQQQNKNFYSWKKNKKSEVAPNDTDLDDELKKYFNTLRVCREPKKSQCERRLAELHAIIGNDKKLKIFLIDFLGKIKNKFIFDFEKKRKIKFFSSLPSLAAILIFVLIMHVFFPISNSLGQSFSFQQTTWNNQTNNSAAHPTNQASWSEFSSKDAGISPTNGGADIELEKISQSKIQTTDADFNAGVQNQTIVNGTGDSANISLDALKPPINDNERMAVDVSLPYYNQSVTGLSSSMVYPGGGDYIYGYVSIDSNSLGLKRYSISNDSWSVLADVPTGLSFGGSLVWAGGDYIYAYQGNSTSFYRYSISGNNWSTMAATPGAIYSGGTLVYPGSGDYIYGYRGNSTTDFYRYSISANSWTIMAASPGSIGNGGALVYPGTGDYIYGYRGSNTTDFYRYSISANSWTIMAASPGSIGNGGALVYPGSGDYIYGNRGNSLDFYRYSISLNSWTSMSPNLLSVNYSSLVYASNYIFSFSVYGFSSVSRYSISANSWTIMNSPPENMGYSSSIVSTKNDYIYAYQGDYSKTFYRYQISKKQWKLMAETPGNIYRGSSLAYPGSGDFIYGYRGNNTTDFYRYSISANTWTIMASTPAAISDGGTLIATGGDYIYGFRGNNTQTFYRYSISGNSWVTMSNALAVPSVNNSSLIYPGYGDFIYAYEGGANYNMGYPFYRYSISQNSWKTLNSLNANGSYFSFVSSGDDYIYAIGTETYRYSISTDTWLLYKKNTLTSSNVTRFVYPGNGELFFGFSSGIFYSYFFGKQDLPAVWQNMKDVPSNLFYGGSIVSTKDDYMYVAIGNSTSDFYRYSISKNEAIKMASIPDKVSDGGALVYPGLGDYIYGFRGGSDNFYRYSISENSWSKMASTPGIIGPGGALVCDGNNYIYGYQGGNKNGFYRYSISANSWTSMANTQMQIGAGGSLVYTGSGDYIYGFVGGGNLDFFQYSISTNTWTAKQNVGNGVSHGASLVYPGSGDYIFGYLGYNSTNFKRYSISTNSWSSMSTTPGSITAGGSLAYLGSGDFIYGTQGGNNITNLFRYSITANSWITISTTLGAGNVAYGSALVSTNNDYLYGFTGNNTTNFMRYTILTDSWDLMSMAPGAISNGGSLVYPKSGDFIYGFRGGNTSDFYRYSISKNLWETMTSTPANIDWGGSLVYPGSGDYIYGFQGNNTSAFYRYSISSNNWQVMAAAPGVIGAGGSLVSINEDSIYAFRGSTMDFYSYSISTNSWTTKAQIIGIYSVGAGGSLVYPGSGDFIYANKGSNFGFFAYSISSNSWVNLNPVSTGLGSSFVYPGSGDYIYGFNGNYKRDFLRYSISLGLYGAWSSVTSTPEIIGSGSALVSTNNGYLYSFTGNSSSGFYRYSSLDDAWIAMASAPGSVSTGGSLVYPDSGDYIYGFRGGDTPTFYRYSISANSWTTMASTPGNIATGGALTYPGFGDYIYGSRGTPNITNNFFRYSISNNSWTILPDMPSVNATVGYGNGASIMADKSGNIYAFPGYYSQTWYRYSIEGNNWSRLADIPSFGSMRGPASGFSMVYPGSGDYIYAYNGDSDRRFLRYSISRNSWALVTPTPKAISSGGALVYPGTGDYIYGYSGGSKNFYRYNIKAFYSSGQYISSIIDTQKIPTYSTLEYTKTTPASTSLSIDARFGNTSTPDATWTAWTKDIPSGASIASFTGNRYIQYRANLSTGSSDVTSILKDISINYSIFPSSAALTSSAYDTGSSANIMGDLSWTENTNLPNGTNVNFAIKTAADQASLSLANWNQIDRTKCSKIDSIVTCSGKDLLPSSMQQSGGNQWFQYKVTLGSSQGDTTPTFSDAQIKYVANAPPEVRNVAAAENDNGTVVITFQGRDPDTATGATKNHIGISLQYCSANCENSGSEIWANASIVSGDFGDTLVNSDGSFKDYRMAWNAKADFNQQYNSSMKVRVLVNDNENANYLGSGISNSFTFDTKDPSNISFFIDHTKDFQQFNIATPNEDSSYQMAFSNFADFHDNPEYVAFQKTYSYQNLTNDPATVYMRIRDQFGNVTQALAQTPQRPQHLVYYDTSNSISNDYREFIAWDVIPSTQKGSGEFGSYLIYRAERDESNKDAPLLYTQIAAINGDRNINHFLDTNLDSSKHYYYKVASRDTFGNTSSFSTIIDDNPNGQGGTDQTPPSISELSVSNITTTSATISWTTDELSDSSVGYSEATTYLPERGVASMVTNHQVVLTNLLPGSTYNLRVKSHDLVGNLAQNDKDNPGVNPIGSFTFSTLPGPAISSVTMPNISNNQATISWKTTTNSSSYIIYSDMVLNGQLIDSEEFGSPDLVGGKNPFNHEVTISTFRDHPLSPNKKYYFAVKSIDIAGNIAIDNNGNNFYELLTTEDNEPPVIENIQASVVSQNNAAISWSTNEPATSQISYRKKGAAKFIDADEIQVYDRSHFVILNKLDPDTDYEFKVASKDINSNEAISTQQLFKTQKDLAFQHDPLTSITIAENNPILLTDTDAVISFSTDQIANCILEYGSASGQYNGIPVIEEKDKYNATHSIHLMGLLFQSEYFYKVTCHDNLVDQKGDYTFIISDEKKFITKEKMMTGGQWSSAGEGEKTPPLISNINITNNNGENSIITWETDKKSNSLVKYGVTVDYENMAGDKLVNSSVANYVTSHSVSINNLIPGTKYYVAVISSDEFGSIAESDQQTFVTPAPSSLSSIQVESKDLGQATITWKTSDKTSSIIEYGLTSSYGEKKENSDLSTEHSIVLSNLNQGVTYHYRVKGIDADNNLFASADNTFQPKSPPQITNIEVNDITEHSAKISFKTNVPTQAEVRYIDVRDEGIVGSQGSRDLSTQHEIVLNNLPQGATFSISISARDEQGTESVQDGKDFTTGKDENPPLIKEVHSDSALTQSDKVQTIISWKTDEQSTTSLIFHESGSSKEQEIKISDALINSHVAVLTAFKQGSVYNFKVKSIDASGNETISNEYALLTPKRQDNIVQIIMGNFMQIFGWAKFKKM